MRVTIAAFLLLLLAVPAFGDQPESEHITIGAIASLTGPAAEQGKNWLRGAELAVKDLAEQERLQVHLLVEDDATRPASATSAFVKLVTIDKALGVIGGTWDFLAESVAPMAARHEIPFISPTNPKEVFSDETAKNPYFRINGLSISATKESISTLIEQLRPKRVAIVVPNVPFGVRHAEAIEEIASRRGVAISSRTDFEIAGYHDTLRSLVPRIIRDRPEAVFCLTDYTALEVFVRELSAKKYSGWILTTQHLDEAAKLSGNAKLWKKVVGFYPDVRNSAFSRRYFEKYGEQPKVYAAEGYDALLFLARLIESKKNTTAEHFETSGVTGRLRSTPGDIELAALKAVPMVVDEKLQLLEFTAQGQSSTD